MRPPRADETDMENRRFLALSVLPFLPRCFFFVCPVCLVCVCVVLSVLLFVFVCLRSRCVLRFFLPCLSVLSCLSCFFYDLMSCAVSCVFFWFVCSSSLCYRYWWHGDGTDMRTPRTDGTDMRTPFLLVTPVVTCWLHWCLLTCLGPCLLVMLVLGCWLCFLITLLLAC